MEAKWNTKTRLVVESEDEPASDRHRTNGSILDIYDEMAEAMKNGKPHQTRLDPPAGPPADAEGNFLPLPQWLPGQPQPADWPSHIHKPRNVEARA